MGVPPHRRDILRILPPDLVEALRQPMPSEARRELIRKAIADEIVRRQALRYVEELRLQYGEEGETGDEGEDRPPGSPD